MAEFKLVKNEENEEDEIIAKSGHTFEFTKSSVIESMLKMAKIKKELTAQLGVNKAEMENYLHFHPFLKDMSEEDLQFAFLYERSFATAKECEKKLEEIAEAEKEIADDVAEIEKQTGLKIEMPQPVHVEIKPKE